jgi:tetratricopeptide (TPR) repeat protein
MAGTRKTQATRRTAFPLLGAFTFCIFIAAVSPAQDSGKTIRHHKVTEPNPDFPVELVEAEASIEKRDYATAEPLLEKIVAANPDNYQAWFDLGFLYHALEKTGDSIAAYRKSVAAKPDVFESNLNLGLSLAAAHQPEAEIYLRAATRLKPTAQVDQGKARAWLSLGHLLETTKPEEAIAAYHQAELLEPADVESRLSTGPLLEKQNRFAEAEQEYKQVLGLDPKSADALTGLANIYMRGRRFPQAEEVLHKLLALRPDDAAAHMQLGRILAAAGKNDDAMAEMQAGLKLAPGDAGLERDLADLYANAGKFEQALALYQSLLLASGNDADLHAGLGQIFLKQHKFAEAEKEFLAVVKLKPDFGAAYGDLAVAAQENKDYELAIRAADARAKFLPEIPMSFFMRASAYDHLRDYKNAATNYHRFLEVAGGKFPDQEWQARHRLIAIEAKKK